MSWLGKILTFLVLIASVVWAAFTVNVYVTRTNWKVRADGYEKAFKDSEAARQSEYNANRVEVEKLARLLEAEKSKVTDLNTAVADLKSGSTKGDEDYKKLLAASRDADIREKLLIAQQTATLNELSDTRKRNTSLEDGAVKLVLAKEAAERERLRFENEAKLQRAIADDNARKIETLTALVTELRQTGGSGTATVLRTIDKVPAPLPDNIRGTVLRNMSPEGFVQISIGIDAGLEPGSRLDIYRETNGGQYLGTLVVTKSVYPKEAIAEFRPARRVPVAQLRPDELPRKDDLVGVISTSTTTRAPNP